LLRQRAAAGNRVRARAHGLAIHIAGHFGELDRPAVRSVVENIVDDGDVRAFGVDTVVQIQGGNAPDIVNQIALDHPARGRRVEADGILADLRGVVPVSDVLDLTADHGDVRSASIGSNAAERTAHDHEILEDPVRCYRVQVKVFVAPERGGGGSAIQNRLTRILRFQGDRRAGRPGRGNSHRRRVSVVSACAVASTHPAFPPLRSQRASRIRQWHRHRSRHGPAEDSRRSSPGMAGARQWGRQIWVFTKRCWLIGDRGRSRGV